MPNTFPSTPQDEVTKRLLDKDNRVTPRSPEEQDREKHKFSPYTEEDIHGEEVTHSPFTDYIYYNKLPRVYREYDLPLNKPLYRYLRSLIDGGYANLVYSTVQGENGIENLFELINPQTCPSEFLPFYCQSMGIEWFQDLVVSHSEGVDPYYYMRTFLSNVGEIYKRRGTESVVKYIAKVLTSKDVKLNYQRTISGGDTTSRILWVELQITTPEEQQEVAFNSEIIQRFINTQIPYYLTSKVLYVIHKADIILEGFTASAVTKVKRQTIVPSAIYSAGADDFIYRIVNGECYIISYKGTATRIAVPRKIENYPVTVIEATAFGYNPELEYVRLPNTVREIQ